MQIITDALILRAGKPLGEADRRLTALSREHGILYANARGVRKINNRNASPTSLLAYSRLTLVPSRTGTYIVTDAQPLRVFFELRRDVVALALAQYWCELACALCPADESADEPLRLLLNALHFLCEDSRPHPLLKALVELRLLAGAGYAPALDVCVRCGSDADLGHLLPREGGGCCASCGQQHVPFTSSEVWYSLSAAALQTLRLFASAPLQTAFGVQLSSKTLPILADAVEAFTLERLGRRFASLELYKTM